MGDVIDFSAEQVILRCMCGCTTFYHHATGRVECAACHHFATMATTEWRKTIPDPEIPVPPEEPDSLIVTNIGSPKWALQRTLNYAEVGKTAVVMVLQIDGALRVWGDAINTDKRKEWFERKCKVAMKMLEDK